MWALAARRFKEGPPSNGEDPYYEKVKAELRKTYGKDAVDKARLKALARSGGLHDEQVHALALLPSLKQQQEEDSNKLNERNATIARLEQQIAERDAQNEALLATNAKLKERIILQQQAAKPAGTPEVLLRPRLSPPFS